jgi:hypothetical protein
VISTSPVVLVGVRFKRTPLPCYWLALLEAVLFSEAQAHQAPHQLLGPIPRHTVLEVQAMV